LFIDDQYGRGDTVMLQLLLFSSVNQKSDGRCDIYFYHDNSSWMSLMNV